MYRWIEILYIGTVFSAITLAGIFVFGSIGAVFAMYALVILGYFFWVPLKRIANKRTNARRAWWKYR